MPDLTHLISTNGYWVIATVVGLESMGVPLPGETALVSAAMYAGTTRQLNIVLVIAVAALGAIVGDSSGFWIGRRFGHALVRRSSIGFGITPQRLKLGQYLFHRHGGKVVFFGRFFAVVRTLAALLAGMNLMSWRRFFLFNATGGIVWATLIGLSAYFFGQTMEAVHGRVAVAGVVLAAAATLAGIWFVRRHESELALRAERELPGSRTVNRRRE